MLLRGRPDPGLRGDGPGGGGGGRAQAADPRARPGRRGARRDGVADVVVVGAGHNGLTCAAFLARDGLDVLVLDSRPVAGGAAATEELVPGYRFSTCAYAVHLLHEAVAEPLGLDLRLIPSPGRVGVLPDGTAARDGDLEPDAFARWERTWDGLARELEPHLLGPRPAEAASGASVRELLHEHFASAEARALYAPRYADAPADAPGSAAAYAYVETGRLRRPEWQGVPEGGMGALAAAFERAARAAGARVELGREVVRIEPAGVTLADGTRVEARAVVSNADPVRTARLLGREPPAVEDGPAAAKLHLALRAAPDLPGEGGLVHLYPSLDWWEGGGSLVELQWPTALDPSLAPPGAHCLSAYVPDARRAGDVLARVRAAVPNLDEILVERVLHAPEDVEARVGLTGGRIHHVPHTPRQMLGGRLDAGSWEGVFLCGAGIHPGGEVSGVPGLRAARAVAEALS